MNRLRWFASFAACFASTSLAIAQTPDDTESVPASDPSGAEATETQTDDYELSDDEAPVGGDLESLLQDRVVATASRSSESANTAPASVYTISRHDLERFGIRTVDEALAFLGVGTFVANSGWDYVSTVDVGVHGVLIRDDNRHLLVLLDGHVMNDQATGVARVDMSLGVPIAAIDHVEVMLGPGSVSFGSNAVLGVVNVVTRRGRDMNHAVFLGDANGLVPTDADRSLSNFRGDADPGVRSRLGIGFGRGFHAFGRDGDVAVHAEFQQDRSATFAVPPQTGDYIEVRPGESAWGLGAARYTMRVPSAVLTGSLGGFRLLLQGSSFRRTVPFSGTWNDSGTVDRQEVARFDLAHDADPSARLHLRSRLYGDYSHFRNQNSWVHPWWCLPGEDMGCAARNRSTSRSIGFEQILGIDWKIDGRFATSVGYDLRFRHARGRPADYYDSVTGQRYSAGPLPSYSVPSFLGAIFIQQLIEAGPKVHVNLGARLDIDSLFGARLSPRASLVYSPRSSTSLRIAYTEAFRGPTVNELEYTDLVYTIPPGIGGLDAEVARFGDVEWIERLDDARLSLRGFGGLYSGLVDDQLATDQQVADAIARGDLAPSAMPGLVVVPANLGRIVSFGGTASIELHPTDRLEVGSGLSSGVAYSVEDGAYSATGRTMPRFYGNARVAYRFDTGDTSVALASAFSSRRDAMTLPGNGADVVVNAKGVGDVRFTLSGRAGREGTGLRYRAGVHYAFNGRSTNLLAPGPRPPDAMGNPDPFASESVVYAPLPRFFVFVGLRYELPVGDEQ